MCIRYIYADDVHHRVCSKVFSGVRVTRSLVLYVYFVDRYFQFYFGHCIVLSFSIYRFWLPLWHLQALLRWIPVVFRSVYRFPRKNDVRVVFIPICVVGGSCFMLFVFMYAYSSPTRLPCHMRTRVAQWVMQFDYLATHTILSPSDKAYQLFVHVRWFSLGTPASLHSISSGKGHSLYF